MGKYDDIMNAQRPSDPDYPSMSMHNRAGQFAPFDALTGFRGRICEASRLTEKRIDLDESAKIELNERLVFLKEHIKDHAEVTVTYFVPDCSKDGGAYATVCGEVRKIDEFEEHLVLSEALSVRFDDILSIEIM